MSHFLSFVWGVVKDLTNLSDLPIEVFIVIGSQNIGDWLYCRILFTNSVIFCKLSSINMYNFRFLLMVDCCKSQRGCLRRPFRYNDISFLFFKFLFLTTERLIELDNLSFDRIFLLEKSVDLELLLLLNTFLFFYVGRIDEDFRIVHRAPADHATVVGESGELIFLNIFVDGFLDVEVFAHKMKLQ